MLLGEQFGGRHERHLPGIAERQRRRRRGHRGLAATDVALHQPRHRLRELEVCVDLDQHARLRGREAERQRAQQPLLQLRASAEAMRIVGLGGAAQRHERELVREQLLERQPPLRRVRPRGQRAELGAHRWLVQELQRFTEWWQPHLRAQLARQVIDQRSSAAAIERAAHEAAQACLAQALGAGIDGRKCLRQFSAGGADAAVFRMHDLQPERPAAHFAVAAQPRAARQPGALRVREMKEAQRQRAAAVAEPHQQLPATAEYHFRQQHFAFDHRAPAGLQRADRHDPRAILIAQRQYEQQVIGIVHAQARQAAGKRRADAAQRRCGVRVLQARLSMHSISTLAPRGSAATPTAARAG